MSNTYVLGKTIADFSNSSDTYIFALRRNEDGELFLLKTNLNETSEDIKLFGNEIPVDFQSMDFPGDDYFEGRAADHTLENPIEDVKYEQWKWVNRTQSYYIDADGYFTLAIGEDINLSQVDDIIIPANHQQTFTIYGDVYDINLFDKLVEMGWNGISKVEVTIEGSIGSTHPSKPALFLDDRAYINGIDIINNGNITGCNGNINNNPVDNRNNGTAIVIDTSVSSFTNTGSLKAGVYNGNYANVFRGYDNIVEWTNTGSWIGYDD
jgi:hypothetical protein